MRVHTNVGPTELAIYADRCQSIKIAARGLDKAKKACFPKVSVASNTHCPMMRQPTRSTGSQPIMLEALLLSKKSSVSCSLVLGYGLGELTSTEAGGFDQAEEAQCKSRDARDGREKFNCMHCGSCCQRQQDVE